jgi:transposase InsO family protein
MKTLCAPSDESPQQNRALARFAAVQAVLQACQNGVPLTQATHQVAQQSWDGRSFAASTLEHWYYRYRHGRFAALQTRPRSDRGRLRALDPAATEALLALRREHPRLTLPALAAELVRRGLLQEGNYSESTLHRRLRAAGLDRASLKAGAVLLDGPTKAFELPLPNLLWMADCMYGPTLSLPQNHATQRTFLFALLDDCSRLCVHGQFYGQERVENFLDCLRQALHSRGVPDKLYTDNGAAFRSQHLQIVCANLGMRLLHTQPYHAWSKGKLERFFLTVQTQFLATLVFQPVHTLPELNQRFWHWVETDYHARPHSSLAGQSPAERFAQLGAHLRTGPPPHELDRLFLMRLTRRVRKDATISLGAGLWEVPAHLRGQIITVHFDPVAWTRVEIWLGDRYLGPAHRCNKQLNAQLRSSNDYHRDTP